MTRTSSPRSASARTTWAPTKPVAPVTHTFIGDLSPWSVPSMPSRAERSPCARSRPAPPPERSGVIVIGLAEEDRGQPPHRAVRVGQHMQAGLLIRASRKLRRQRVRGVADPLADLASAAPKRGCGALVERPGELGRQIRVQDAPYP